MIRSYFLLYFHLTHLLTCWFHWINEHFLFKSNTCLNWMHYQSLTRLNMCSIEYSCRIHNFLQGKFLREWGSKRHEFRNILLILLCSSFSILFVCQKLILPQSLQVFCDSRDRSFYKKCKPILFCVCHLKLRKYSHICDCLRKLMLRQRSLPQHEKAAT